MGRIKKSVIEKRNRSIANLKKSRYWRNPSISLRPTKETELQESIDLPLIDSKIGNLSTSHTPTKETEQQESIDLPLINSQIGNDTDDHSILSGRRIVDVVYFVKALQNMKHHPFFDCKFSDMEVVKETRIGLLSELFFKCKVCNIEQRVFSEDPKEENSVNTAAVLATLSTGCGHSQMVEQHAILNIPQMSFRQYSTSNDYVQRSLYQTMEESMAEAGKEELRLAIELGEVDSEGNGLIAVIVDGAWSKRSYRTKYDASSGVVSYF